MRALKPKTTINPWLIAFIGVLFFFFQFIQLNVFNALGAQLANTFSLNTTQLGFFSATYLYAVALSFLPSGFLLDRYSSRQLMLTGMGISIVCVIIFALSPSLTLAVIARFLAGLVHGMAFLGGTRFIAYWLSSRIALGMGLMTTIALSGGILVQPPLVLLSDTLGWRTSVLIIAGAGCIAWAAMYRWLVDPPQHPVKKPHHLPFAQALMRSVRQRQNWICPIFTALLNLPLIVLGALWGNRYLADHAHLDRLHASQVVMMIYIGTILGAPCIGWLSDATRRRKPCMIVGALGTLLSGLAITCLPHLSFSTLIILFFALGFFTSTQSLTYSVVTESNVTTIRSTVMGFISLIIMGSAALFQPFFGYLIQASHQVTLFQHTLHGHQLGSLMLVVAFTISVVLALLVRETHSKPLEAGH